MKNNKKFIVGLGNPGPRYTDTRHNFGWFVLDELASNLDVKKSREVCGGMIAESQDMTLFKPMSFMNKSGGPVTRLVGKFDISCEDLLIVMDDLDLNLGTIRLRKTGSPGGHKGLKNIIDSLGTNDVRRLRLGIGPCPSRIPPRDFVLGKFSDKEWATVEKVIKWGVKALNCWAEEGIEKAMNRFNKNVNDQVD